MNITENLKKPYWTRRVTVDTVQPPHAGDSGFYTSPDSEFGTGLLHLTSSDFLNEIAAGAHEINSRYRSQRPIYAPTGEKDESGREKYQIVGYDEVERTPFSIQEFIISKKVAHLTGRKFWIACEDEDEKKFGVLRSWFDDAGIWDAFKEWVWYAERDGDAAVYIYQRGAKVIDYEVFAAEKGDMLFPSIDEQGREMLYRAYTLNGRSAVDIYRADYIETWVKIDETSDRDRKWLPRILAKLGVRKSDPTKSDDGYTRIMHKDAQVGDDLLQVVYVRIPDIATGCVQEAICSYEKAYSFIGEQSKSNAFPILFVKSTKIASLPPSDFAGKSLGITGSSESLEHADAKFLQPGDASNTVDMYVDKLWENIKRGTMSAFVEPGDLRSGVDNSISIRILFAPDIEWAMNRWIFYAKPVKQIVEIMKRLVGKVEGDYIGYSDLRVSSGQNIYLPQNDTEELQMVLDKVYARVMSRKAALEDIAESHKGDYEQIMKEWEAELRMQSEIPAQVEQEYNTDTGADSVSGSDTDNDNPGEPDVDNKAAGKSSMASS